MRALQNGGLRGITGEMIPENIFFSKLRCLELKKYKLFPVYFSQEKHFLYKVYL